MHIQHVSPGPRQYHSMPQAQLPMSFTSNAMIRCHCYRATAIIIPLQAATAGMREPFCSSFYQKHGRRLTHLPYSCLCSSVGENFFQVQVTCLLSSSSKKQFVFDVCFICSINRQETKLFFPISTQLLMTA